LGDKPPVHLALRARRDRLPDRAADRLPAAKAVLRGSQVPFRQPLAHIGRHQERLLAITRDEALRHDEIVLTSIVR